MNHILHPDTSKICGYTQLDARKFFVQDATTWVRSFLNEFGCLDQGVGNSITSTNTIFFTSKSKIPKGRVVMYACLVCNIRPQKEETHRIQMTVSGNLLDYLFDVYTPSADITTAKLMIKSTLLMRVARCLIDDIKYFYLNTAKERYEYMRIHISIIPKEIIYQYNLFDLVDENGWVYIKI